MYLQHEVEHEVNRRDVPRFLGAAEDWASYGGCKAHVNNENKFLWVLKYMV
jgi:hypothetical protein